MSKKYIVKNCPACHNYYKDEYVCEQMRDTFNALCQNNTDCLIKQVVEKCKEQKEQFSKLPDGVAFDLTTLLGNLQDEILQLFTIEEVE